MSEILLVRPLSRSLESAKNYEKNGLHPAVITCSRLLKKNYDLQQLSTSFPCNAVITSSNAIDFLPDPQNFKQIFCVGEKTAQNLKNKNYNSVFAGKNSAQLKQYLEQNLAGEQLVYFRAEHIHADLKSDKYDLSEVICYEIEYFENQELLNELISDEEKYLPIYSTNTGAYIANLASKNCIYVAISPVVAKTLDEFENVITASEPSEEAVIKAILEHQKRI